MQCTYQFNFTILFVSSLVNICLTCHTFANLSVEISPNKGNPFNKYIIGCIEPSRFSDDPDLQVVQVKIFNQPIVLLKKGTVQNLARLKYIVLNNTSTKIVEPETFRHLPRLAGLFIIHSQLEIVRNNVFQNLPSLNKLRLHQNKISEIENYAFSNIPSLKYVFISNNKIKQWDTTWFINSTTLEEIDFQKNLLSKIPANAFPGLRNLSKILLDYNKISEIESNAFEDITHLEWLSLRFNCLKLISADIFVPKVTVDILLIDSNILNYIGNEVLDRVSLKEISLSGNPWKCPCLQRTLFWFYQNHGTTTLCKGCTGEQPVCIFPTSYASTCLDINDEEASLTYFNLSNNTEIITKCFEHNPK